MGNVVVKYNSQTLDPTPTVSRSYQFLDYGPRFGQIEQIDLNGYLGRVTTDYQAAIDDLLAIFAGQFKTLEVLDDGATIYNWPNIVVQDINIAPNSFLVGSYPTYNVKLISYQVPSGVIDPVNEYSFSQGEDGIVTVNHQISAKGIKGANGALDSAINFVNTFVRKNPYTNCTPYFINNSSGILMNISEQIDRANCTYSVTEQYKYLTGAGTNNYIQTESLSIDSSASNDYTNVDLTVRIQGSPVDNNLSSIRDTAEAIDTDTIFSSYGISPSLLIVNGFTVSENSGEAFVEVKYNYISGLNSDESNGVFDYSVSMDKDFLTSESNWKVNGEFSVKGPVNYKNTKISGFKDTNESDGYSTYLTKLVTGSPLWSKYGEYTLTLDGVNLTENSGIGLLQLNGSFNNRDTVSGLIQPSYTIDVEPQIWRYDLLPSANIEGHYTLQDYQTKTKAKVNVSVNATTTGTTNHDISVISSVASILTGVYVSKSSFLIGESLNSGKFNAETTLSVIGEENQGSSISNTKVYGSHTSKYNRPPNFKFGY